MALLAVPGAPAFTQNATPVRTVSRDALRGRVIDARSRTPIITATIEASLVASPGSVAARAHAGADGSFRLQGLRAGRYRIRVRALGFAPRVIADVAVDGKLPGKDVGDVALAPVAVEMQRVVVQERRRDVQLEPDRNTYEVRDMPTTRGGNALDVLRNVPAVDVDIDNVVSLRGNSGVVVQINGRPSPMKPSQLGNFLAQLPAAMVEKVEVIPNPSARDDPEGVSGIINIVLRQETDIGSSGGLTIGAGTTGRAEVGGNLGWQRGPWSLYGSYGFLRDNRPRSDSIYRENLYLDPLTYLSQRGHRTQSPLAHTATGSAAFRPNEHDELSADVMFSTRAEDETGSILYRNLDASRVLTGTDHRVSSGSSDESNFEGSLAYKHAFAEKRHELKAEVRLFQSREGGPSDFATHAQASDGTPMSLVEQEAQTGFERPSEQTVKLDYRRPLTSNLRLEAGYKGSRQRFHTTLDTQVYDTLLTALVADTARSSDFTYGQVVNAGYGMLGATAGPFSLQGGVRVERATTRFRLNRRDATYDNAYNSIFPSALVAYDIDESRRVKLSYSTRIRRPNDADLIDPTIHYDDPLNVSRGNPKLKPEYIRALELGLQQTGEHVTVQVTPYYRHTLDAVRTLRTLDSAGVATRTFANVATSDAYGTDVTVALHAGRLGGFVGASAFRQVSNASNLDSSLSVRTFGWTARTNAAFHVSPTLDFQTLLFYRAPMTVEQGRIDSRLRFSLAARKKLMDDKLSVALRLIDPFNSSRQRSTTIDPRFVQVSERWRADRGLLLSVNWSFGSAPKLRDGDEPDRDREDGDEP
jgi:outer membrane cobalamin receptor